MQAGTTIFLLQLVGIGLIFYFLIMRPQAQARKRTAEMLAAIKLGDEITTAGGIIGKVRKVRDNEIHVESGTAELVIDRSRIIRVGDQSAGIGG